MIPPPIKLPDLSDAQAPKWGADKLSRKEIADALTCAIHCHGETMSIALNGVLMVQMEFLVQAHHLLLLSDLSCIYITQPYAIYALFFVYPIHLYSS